MACADRRYASAVGKIKEFRGGMGKTLLHPRFPTGNGEDLFRDRSSNVPSSGMEQGRDLLLRRQLAARRQLVDHSRQNGRQLVQ